MKKKSKSKAHTDNNELSVLYCSWCGKSQHEVERLIAGPATFICGECVILCLDIILEMGAPKSRAEKTRMLKKLDLFTGMLLDKHEPVLNELIEKGYCGSIDHIIYDFLEHAVKLHNQFAGLGNQKPINAELLEFPPSE